MRKGKPKIDPADRLDQRILILFNESDVDRINRYCEHNNKGAARGLVLRTIIMLTVGKWEKRSRKVS